MTLVAQIGMISRRAIAALLGATIAVLLVIMTLQITFRYGFNSSLIWAEEVCRHLLIWASFLACFAAYERGEIAAVTMLRDSLPNRAGLALAILANVLALALLVFLVIYGLSYAERIGSQPIPALGFIFNDLGTGWSAPSMFWVYIALPVGMALLTIRFVVDIIHYAVLFRTGGHASDLRARPADPIEDHPV